MGSFLAAFFHSQHRFCDFNSSFYWLIVFSTPILEIKFKPFLPPLCVIRVEPRDEIVTLVLLLLSIPYPGDKCVTEEHREMFTDT